MKSCLMTRKKHNMINMVMMPLLLAEETPLVVLAVASAVLVALMIFLVISLICLVAVVAVVNVVQNAVPTYAKTYVFPSVMLYLVQQ